MSRPLRISICAFNETGPGPADCLSLERLERALTMARRARDEGARLAVFPEDFLLVDAANRFAAAEPLDGPVFSKIAATARELEMFIAANHPALIDGQKYNTTVLFNHRGQLEGFYLKAYPTMEELAHGCRPGKGPVVLDTELGRIGLVTCFDLNFEDLRHDYTELDPDLILFTSFYRGGLQTQIWAFETRSYMVCATINPGSRIVNPVGRVVKYMDIFARQLTHTLELDYQVLHLDRNLEHLDLLRERYGRDIDVDWAEAEGVMLLSATGSTPLRQIMAELDLHSARTYFDLSRQSIQRANSPMGVPTPPQAEKRDVPGNAMTKEH